MASAVVKDFVIWLKHVHDDARLAQHLSDLASGAVVTLKVDGVPGKWRKMDNGKDGRPTAGIRPLGAAKEFWNALYAERRGDVISIELADDGETAGAIPHVTRSSYGVLAEEASQFRGLIERSDPVMREAAFAALLDPNRQLYTPDESIIITRDDMHDRDLDRLR